MALRKARPATDRLQTFYRPLRQAKAASSYILSVILSVIRSVILSVLDPEPEPYGSQATFASAIARGPRCTLGSATTAIAPSPLREARRSVPP